MTATRYIRENRLRDTLAQAKEDVEKLPNDGLYFVYFSLLN